MFLILKIVLIIFLFSGAYAASRGAPWFPTRKKDVERFLRLAKITPDCLMYDLGCGDGRLVVAAAENGARARGLELSLFPWFLAQVRRLASRRRSAIEIRWQDLWQTDLSDARLVYVWLTPAVMPRLREKLARELKSGAKVIAYVWPFTDWTPVAVDKEENQQALYLYRID